VTRQKTILDQTAVMQKLDTVVAQMDDDRKQKFLQWVDVQTNYLQWEDTFNPKKLLAYKRRDLVHMNFGFNVGSEIGGLHWGVVVENKNHKGSDCIVVVPLSSLEDAEDENNLHETEVYLGTIPEINDRKVKACVAQIRNTSKIRIYKPRNKKHKMFRITEAQMDLIDEKVTGLFTFQKKD
jgi:mRNA interferase MazF